MMRRMSRTRKCWNEREPVAGVTLVCNRAAGHTGEHRVLGSDGTIIATWPELLTTRQAADRCGVNPTTVTRWVKAGRLKAANPPPDGKKSARYLFTPADVDNLT